MIERTTFVVRTDGLTTAPVEQDLVILNMAGNNYICLDSIGRRIWVLLERPIRVDDLCRRLGEEYTGDEEQIYADLIVFLTRLERDGLVRIAEGVSKQVIGQQDDVPST